MIKINNIKIKNYTDLIYVYKYLIGPWDRGYDIATSSPSICNAGILGFWNCIYA